jgi:putative FmdB family regulatory protein
MPLYSFGCPDCNNVVEIKFSFAQHDEYKNLVTCAVCKAKMVQCVESVGFNLVGGGWYKEGYSPAFSQSTSQQDLDKELKIYDQHRDNSAVGKHDRHIEED